MLYGVLFFAPMLLLIASWLVPLCVFLASIDRRGRRERWRADGTCAGCGYPRAGLSASVESDADGPLCPECGWSPRPTRARRQGVEYGLACVGGVGALAIAGVAAPMAARAWALQAEGFLLLLPSVCMFVGIVAVFIARAVTRELSTWRRLWIVGLAAGLQIVSGHAWASFHVERLASMG